MVALELLHTRVERLEHAAQLAMISNPPDEISEDEIIEALKEHRPRATWEFGLSRARDNRWIIRVTIRHKSGGARKMTYELMYYPSSRQFSVEGTYVRTLDAAAQRIWEHVRRDAS